MSKEITILSPGRICLFGDHQDYLGLPVIACAIDRKITLTATENSEDLFLISMPDINSERSISIFDNFEELAHQDFFGSVLRTLKRYGCIPNKGYNITLRSNIPINAGVSSSSAVVVSWVHFLLKAFGCDQPIDSDLIARLAYEAEVVEQGSPGGRMDQYTIAIGNIIYIDTSEASTYKTLGKSMSGLILAESGIAKDTIGLLSHVKINANMAIDFVKLKHPNFELKDVLVNDYERFMIDMPKELTQYFIAAIKNHHITKEAVDLFDDVNDHIERLGTLMIEHHEILRDQLKITVPKIDAMIDAALNAGAYGAKIVGSGGGGSVVALAPPSKEDDIIEAMLKSGATNAFQVSVSNGSQSS